MLIMLFFLILIRFMTFACQSIVTLKLVLSWYFRNYLETETLYDSNFAGLHCASGPALPEAQLPLPGALLVLAGQVAQEEPPRDVFYRPRDVL